LEISPSAGGAGRARACARAALDRGLFIRPLGNILYLWPPLTTTADELARMLALLEEALRA
ncbi:MAG: adenosylmethionine--8-amino-7-oxononanoate aminotransferase BioA, partial [Planctomycetes bacterium]|nr:adenosylmethionine--8-amino-7-oxononanoate aminotransferase BioA [Planctomycetota bacterium]